MEKNLLALGLIILVGASLYLNQKETFSEVDMARLYNQWKVQHNKRYLNVKDEMYRFNIFMHNVNTIKKFNENPGEFTYTMGINQFTDLTNEEFVRTYLNFKVPEIERKDESNYQPQGDSIDWVEAGYVPSVKNQGQCGACWAFSTIGTLEINSKIQFGENINLSEQDLIDCSGRYGNQGCNGGDMHAAFNYIKDKGIARGEDYPYIQKSQTCKSVQRLYHKVVDVVEIKDCVTLRDAIFSRSIAVAVDATNFNSYQSGIFNNCKTSLIHTVILVGVDENGVWKIRNSWGAAWGEQGYIRLAAGNTCGVCLYGLYPVLQ